MNQGTSPRRATRRAQLALAMALGTLVAIAAPTAAFAWTNDTFSSSSESEMITLINEARASAGLPALVEMQGLTDIARWRSKDMNDRGYFSHAIPDAPGGMVFDELHRQGICYTLAGENIGYNNYPDDVATQTMFNGWMNSPEHRKLILGTGFSRIGLGAFKGTGGTYPRHYWTAVFSHPCKASSPKPAPAPTKPPAAAPKAVASSASSPTPAPKRPPIAAQVAATSAADSLLLGDALYALWRDIVAGLYPSPQPVARGVGGAIPVW